MKYLICNLKAHKTYPEMLIYKDNLRNLETKGIELILAPSNIYLQMFKRENINLCTQNLSLNNDLYLTGDISLEQLQSLDVKYALVGHYERRKYYHEEEQDIILKIKNALSKGLKVIYCIGETKEELARRIEYQVLEKQIARILNNFSNIDLKNIIIAYEPIYMLEESTSPNFNKLKENISFIKNLIYNYYQDKVKVVYGGNVNIDNIKEFTKIKNLDGLIIGAACLNTTNIQNIIDNITSEK